MRRLLVLFLLLVGTAINVVEVGTAATIDNALTRITSPGCGQAVSGKVRLETEIVCADTTALIVDGSKTTIDLNGHSISCAGPGAGGSCQCRDADPFDECLGPEPDVGIDVQPGLSRVRIEGPGTISGFDFGIRLAGGTRNRVEDLLITSPVPDSEADRGDTAGIQVSGTGCGGAPRALSVVGNEIRHHTTGVDGVAADCTVVRGNLFAWNSSITRCTHGIHFGPGSDGNALLGNALLHNGFGYPCDGGLELAGDGNTVAGNLASRNDGQGLIVEGAANDVVGNTSTFHSFYSGLRIAGDENLVSRNLVTDTFGDAVPLSAFSVVGQRNRITRNTSLRNDVGLYASGGDNVIALNTLLGNSSYDAAGGSDSDLWDPNNVCETQTTPVPPPGVCNPGEGS